LIFFLRNYSRSIAIPLLDVAFNLQADGKVGAVIEAGNDLCFIAMGMKVEGDKLKVVSSIF
jgi:hypothetical protein